ncbi:MAG: hypothetical protein GX130_14420 [Candidatus Hydrogenedens sp.]|jgi:hypothetical protein|nr:hypothetical protein [Candidatus Hydrogenedens sp.]
MLHKKMILWIPLVALLLLTGCNTLSSAPQITKAAITPEVLRPGDTAIITMHIHDRSGIVNRVEGVVLESPPITFKLNDDGQDPDEKANDGIWSMQVHVPFQAPPGEFRLEFTAYGKDGTPISVRDRDGHIAPLQQLIPLRIEYTQ